VEAAMKNRIRGPIVSALGGLMVVSVGLSSAAAAPPPVSPTDRVAIVTANLLEGFSGSDVRDPSDMDVFVNRVLNLVRYRPDILLLQEVNSKSARYVAAELTRRTKQTYAVIADAGDKAYRETDTRIIKRDTAIVINTESMSETGRSGYIITRTDRGGNSKIEYKYNARALVRENGGTLSLALASIHVPPNNITRTATILATKLDNAYPSSAPEQFEVLGGDFNQVGIDYESYGQVETHPFWDALTGRFDYVDSIYNVLVGKGVDYLFVRGGVWGAGIDSNYDDRTSKSSPSFYSDHKLRWTIVGPDDQVPSTPGNAQLAARGTGDARMKVSWGASTDNAGIAAYDIFRSTDGNTFRKHGTTTNVTYYDETVRRGTKYWYYVVARDFSDNRSAPTATLTRDA
jgi:hypothetical protein